MNGKVFKNNNGSNGEEEDSIKFLMNEERD